MGDAETLEQLPCLGIGVPRQRQQHVLGPDIGRTELARLLVRSQEGGLRIRRERWGDIGALAHLGLFLQLRRDRLRVGIDLLEHVPHDVVLERGVQEVVGVEVQAPPLERRLSRSLQELAGRVAEELRDVDALHLALLNGHALPGAGTGIAEEIGEEVVEEARRPPRRRIRSSATSISQRYSTSWVPSGRV